mmetsp:Transcript_43663/g.129246  ORF Transcript_43663/g.129246 Transcript_43663/m.129246 type:complete len:302 (-) Transcript_43663:625-1530(-)
MCGLAAQVHQGASDPCGNHSLRPGHEHGHEGDIPNQRPRSVEEACPSEQVRPGRPAGRGRAAHAHGALLLCRPLPGLVRRQHNARPLLTGAGRAHVEQASSRAAGAAAAQGHGAEPGEPAAACGGADDDARAGRQDRTEAGQQRLEGHDVGGEGLLQGLVGEPLPFRHDRHRAQDYDVSALTLCGHALDLGLAPLRHLDRVQEVHPVLHHGARMLLLQPDARRLQQGLGGASLRGADQVNSRSATAHDVAHDLLGDDAEVAHNDCRRILEGSFTGAWPGPIHDASRVDQARDDAACREVRP